MQDRFVSFCARSTCLRVCTYSRNKIVDIASRRYQVRNTATLRHCLGYCLLGSTFLTINMGLVPGDVTLQQRWFLGAVPSE